MKKIFTLATAAFLFTGAAFAHSGGNGKSCGKDEKGCTKACCKKDDKKATKAAVKETGKEVKAAGKSAAKKA